MQNRRYAKHLPEMISIRKEEIMERMHFQDGIILFAGLLVAVAVAVACGVVIAAMGAWRTLEETGERAY
jgi:hypothetical protein